MEHLHYLYKGANPSIEIGTYVDLFKVTVEMVEVLLIEFCPAAEKLIVLVHLSGRHTATNTSNDLGDFRNYEDYATHIALTFS